MQITPQILENHIVRLEPLTELHREPLRPLANDMSMWPQTTMQGNGEHFDTWFDAMLNATNAGKQISHAVFSKASDQYVGHSAYLVISADHKRLEIGWTWYEASVRGSKINPACKRLLIGNAFDNGAERVELKTAAVNKRSQAAMRKMGATEEGTFRRHILTWSGEWRDTVWFSILKEEWPSARDGLDARLV
ncbi:MAG: GNAT family protein [Maricaulis sp.]|jgi:RimJ/RimL family protein N-acetyltransferase|nr:GNAT family protein [Maricaulis sp.]